MAFKGNENCKINRFHILIKTSKFFFEVFFSALNDQILAKKIPENNPESWFSSLSVCVFCAISKKIPLLPYKLRQKRSDSSSVKRPKFSSEITHFIILKKSGF